MTRKENKLLLLLLFTSSPINGEKVYFSMPFLGIYCFAYLHCLHIYALYF